MEISIAALCLLWVDVVLAGMRRGDGSICFVGGGSRSFIACALCGATLVDSIHCEGTSLECGNEGDH